MTDAVERTNFESNVASGYIPTTEEVRHAHVGKQAVCVNHGDWITEEQWAEFGAEFDRWLAEVKAQAWEEGCSWGVSNFHILKDSYKTNPNREEK